MLLQDLWNIRIAILVFAIYFVIGRKFLYSLCPMVIMPGAAMNDFGDAVRIGASTALEDEQNLDKVWCDLELFEACAKGFIEGCGGKLSQEEIKLLPMGAKLMTYECGMRFLMDYIQGDIYFKIHRPGQNLDRARTQFKLVSDMEHKWKEMENIVKKYM